MKVIVVLAILVALFFAFVYREEKPKPKTMRDRLD